MSSARESLAPFRPGVDGPWDRGAAAHLARRAGFGMPPADVDRLLQLGPAAAVKDLLREREGDPDAARLLDSARLFGGLDSAQSWWAHVLLHGRNPLREKLALFWHGHFATSNRKVEKPRLMLEQVALFREHGLGPFGELVRRIARDPAMLIWLDSNMNRRGKPNENFARELMELFTLGIGNYSEVDIKEAARAFTGWHIRGDSFWFNERAHDSGSKEVLGKSDVESGDDVVAVCVGQKSSARFIAGKLYRFFVHPDPAGDVLEAAGGAFEECGLHVGRFLEGLLGSRAFFSAGARRAIIGSPADYAIGTLHTLGASAAPRAIVEHLSGMGQELLQPPNVKGWDGGRAWISSTSLIARLRFIIELIEGGALNARVPWEELTGGGGRALDEILGRLFPEGASGSLRSELARTAGSDDPKRILAAVLQLPEYQMV